MKDFIKASAIVADADGRVDLTDETLAKFEQLFIPRAGGVIHNYVCNGSNDSCMNDSCPGSGNTNCSNSSCRGSTTQRQL